MNVLLLSPFFRPNVGGVETHLTDLTNSLNKRDYKVNVITYSPITTRIKAKCFEKDENLEVRRVRWFGGNLFHKLEGIPLMEFLYLTPLLFLKSFLFMLSRGKEIDVIHAHGLNAAMAARMLNVFFPRRIVMSSHAIYNLQKGSLLSKMIRTTLSGFDRILTLSKQSKEELASTGISKDKISVYTYWVDRRFSPAEKIMSKKRIGWKDKFIVLFVGRFIEIKGMDLLMNIAKTTKEVHFAFIGDGPLKDKVIKEAAENENIIYVGRVPNEQLPKYYNAADIFCIPSKYEEGFGRVIIEAISCGVPVIGSNIGGIPEAIDDSVGMLVEPKEGDIKQAIEYLFKNPVKLKGMRDKCEDYAKKRFGESNINVIERGYEI